MTSRERILAAVKGDKPDRLPFSIWRHFNLTPRAGQNLADAEVEFYNAVQPDFLKVMHDIDFETAPAINSPEDWANIPELDPNEGNFGQQLETLRLIREKLGTDVIIIETVFNSFYWGNQICGGKLLEQIAENPQAVSAGMKLLNESIYLYAKACLTAGCDGIYYAMNGACSDSLDSKTYRTMFLDLDRRVLEGVADAPFNVCHAHGYKELYFDMYKNINADVLCWSDRITGFHFDEAREISELCFMGGIDETTFDTMTKDEMLKQAEDAVQQTKGKRFILAPGCAVKDGTPLEQMALLNEVAKQVKI